MAYYSVDCRKLKYFGEFNELFLYAGLQSWTLFCVVNFPWAGYTFLQSIAFGKLVSNKRGFWERKSKSNYVYPVATAGKGDELAGLAPQTCM